VGDGPELDGGQRRLDVAQSFSDVNESAGITQYSAPSSTSVYVSKRTVRSCRRGEAGAMQSGVGQIPALRLSSSRWWAPSLQCTCTRGCT
jgi:hypothetical protein